jgi:hypothetical protein
MITRINNIIDSLKRRCHCEKRFSAQRSDEAISKRTFRGQTALILILVTAAALIFLAITLNWGRIAQTKTSLTMAADQSASLLASDAASNGEMLKQTWLGDKNKKSDFGGWIIAVITVIVAIIGLVFACFGAWYLIVLAAVALTMAAVNLALQIMVVQPGITSLWNKLMKDQPIYQQFYEQGIMTALQGAVGDQVNITDYFDWNANGVFGNNGGLSPNDTVSRFAVFYTDRLKMLNQPLIPQLVFFYNQLGELMNGETCGQNISDYNIYPSAIALNPACANLNAGMPPYCIADPIDPACQMKIPGGFQLNDACVNSDPSNSATYNPYCDPCCQALIEDPGYDASSPNPLHPNKYMSLRPSNCSPPTILASSSCFTTSPNDSSCVPSQCVTNNPYCTTGSTCNYPYIYDPAYQNYASGVSFLAQYGRDQPMIPTGSPSPLTSMTPKGNFPNGIYPFFWLMKDYSPKVDTIDPTTTPLLASSPELHWCAPATTTSPPNNGGIPTFTNSTGFSDLAQLNLTNSSGYSCQGKDCCVNYLADKVTSVSGILTPVSDGTTKGTTNGVIDIVGSSSNPASSPCFGEFGCNGSNIWLEGDNQMCLTSAPYNGNTSVYPDGTCEWTGGSASPGTTTTLTQQSTVDSLDDTMHTLSDFVNFSNNILGKDVATLSKTFSSWYPQAAQWIAPASGSASTRGTDPLTGSQCDLMTDPDCNILDHASSLSGQGRLLSIYNPANYPNVPGMINNTSPGNAVDKLHDGYQAITSWLNNSYASDSAWCVPLLESTLIASSPTEYMYIINNSGALSKTTFENAFPNPPATLEPSYGDAIFNELLSNHFVNSNGYVIVDLTSSVILTTLQTEFTDPGEYQIILNILQQAPFWGSLSNVIACLNYNASSAANAPIYNYTKCQEALSTSTCPSSLPTACVPAALGRTLATTDLVSSSVGSPPAPPAFSGSHRCDPAYTDTTTTPPTPSFAKYVSDSLALFTDEAPKFALRAQFLNDIYTRAKTMQTIFASGDAALKSFLKPCGSAQTCQNGALTCPTCADGSTCGLYCADGGPAAQLIYASSQPSPTANLPNSVIYGWTDKSPSSGSGGCMSTGADGKSIRVGCSHIVKVTAYSPGRKGSAPYSSAPFVYSDLPWIQTSSDCCTRTYKLVDRDGYVYVSIKRWDEDHGNPITFPNNHTLWQFLFHKPGTATTTGGDPTQACNVVYPNNIYPIGFGLESQTVTGLGQLSTNLSSQDKTSLSSAFMLNDEGFGANAGKVDPSAAGSGQGPYSRCLSKANDLLQNAPESHACAMYIASSSASGASGDNSFDYSLKFVDCNSISGFTSPTVLEDLKGQQ